MKLTSRPIAAGYVRVGGIVIRSTEKALLLETDNGNKCWIPKSQIIYSATKEVEDLGIIYTELDIPQWLAREKGIVSENAEDVWGDPEEDKE